MADVKLVKGFLTDKGVIKPAVREALKEQARKNLLSEFTLQPNGDLTFDLAKEGNVTIRARLTLTISTKDSFEVVSKTKNETKVISIPNLFD